MIKNENRLKKNKHFKFIYKHGSTKSTKFVALTYLKSKYSPYKVGFSVSKKIGKSVVRNKVKRRMREAFCAISSCVDQTYNYIFSAKEGIQNLTFLEIKQEIVEAVKKCNLYDNI